MIENDPRAAAAALLDGGLVILPTETVYGLAGRADDPSAVARLYAAKGRPLGHPVIVHVADAASALSSDSPNAWVRDVPDYARALAEEFWPGPLTLVLPRAERAGDHVTGGQDTVGIRVPGHDLARSVIAAMDTAEPDSAPHGVAAPSANRFGRVSPTTFGHAWSELGDALDPERDSVLDGGACSVGVESTIVDCTGPAPRVLRPGAVSIADVERVTGLLTEDNAHGIRVPGALPSHYAPQAHLVLATDEDSLLAYADAALEGGTAAPNIGVIAPPAFAVPDGVQWLLRVEDSSQYAHDLYAALHQADAVEVDLIIAVLPDSDPEGVGDAIIDRLRRAAAPR